MQLPLDIDSVKGFFDPEEGGALYQAVRSCARLGICLEIGSYCGKSAVYIGLACKEEHSILFTIDHHRGSEENQPGWDYHDTDLWQESIGAMESLPYLRQTLHQAGLEDTVIPVVGRSEIVARHWRTPLALLFIDGGHTMGAALTDYRLWHPHLVRGGLLAIHDVFPDPADGGRAPCDIYKMALNSGLFEELKAVKSLRLLQRI
jgi:predicted O-methyltransferase YrrM